MLHFKYHSTYQQVQESFVRMVAFLQPLRTKQLRVCRTLFKTKNETLVTPGQQQI